MASSSSYLAVALPIYLGYLDEQVNKKNFKFVSYQTNKVGGTPNWCSVTSQHPTCSRCKRRMLMVIQLYAPLEGNQYHRTLHMFSCIAPECWNKAHSWTCLRSQCLEKKEMTKKPLVDHNWMMEAEDDDWGAESSEDEEDNGNTIAESNLVLQFQKKSSTTTTNLNELASSASSSTNSPPSVEEMTKALGKNMNLNEGDSNANESMCGAVAMQEKCDEGMEASALIEGSEEGDMIAVESPMKTTTDIPALFKEAARVDPTPETEFNSFFVSTGLEPQPNNKLSDHERELLLRYTQETGHQIGEIGGNDGNGDGVYEKSAAHHGDLLLHKFKKRVSRSPQQIIRYCRDDSAKPLWLHPPLPREVPTKCNYCKGKLTFEAQIMPQLISCLRLNSCCLDASVLEFGTVAIYTCQASCWKEGDTTRMESVIVQDEFHHSV